MIEWQPIKTAPKDGVDVLLFFPEAFTCQKYEVAGFFHGEWMRYDTSTFINEPTHWMPLPKPPTD